MPTDQDVLIALGGNLPLDGNDPAQTLQHALVSLAKKGVPVRAVSRFFRTPCFPPGAGPDYVNAVAQVRWNGTASDLLTILHGVEAEFGRERIQRWGMRTLDLDLVAMGAKVLPDLPTYHEWADLPASEQAHAAPEQLILPHPRLQDRPFVLVPLMDIAPGWKHPVSGQSVREMVENLPKSDVEEVVPL